MILRNELPTDMEKFQEAINAAHEKVHCYHCRHRHYTDEVK